MIYLRDMMEKLGRGSVMIQKVCKEKGLPAPACRSEESSGVTFNFYTPEVTPKVTPEVQRLLKSIKGEMPTVRKFRANQ